MEVTAIGRVWRGAIFGALLTLPIGGRAQAVTPLFDDFSSDSAELQAMVERATVKVFAAETGSQRPGAATIIDDQSGLLVTAAHVIAGKDEVWIGLPESTARVRAVPVPITWPAGTPPRDFAVLKVDDPEDLPGALEVQFSSISGAATHSLAGFAHDSDSPIWGTGKLTQPGDDPCAYEMREWTNAGDSGSPIVSNQGLLDGIVVSGRFSGSVPDNPGVMGESRVLPMSCVEAALTPVVPDDQSDAILKVMSQSDEGSLHSSLYPPPGRHWISNLRLDRALFERHQARQSDAQLPPFAGSQRMQELMVLMLLRDLNSAAVYDFLTRESPTQFAAADVLQKAGDDLRKSGKNPAAIVAFGLAENSYLTFASDPTVVTRSDSAGRLEIAAAYKAAADSKIKFAEITGNPSDYSEAWKIAGAAAANAPEGELRQSALAAVAVAADRAGETDVALPAYASAIDQGVQPSWLTNSFGLAAQKAGVDPSAIAKLTPGFFEDQKKSVLDIGRFSDIQRLAD
jgi:hypothetical protein